MYHNTIFSLILGEFLKIVFVRSRYVLHFLDNNINKEENVFLYIIYGVDEMTDRNQTQKQSQTQRQAQARPQSYSASSKRTQQRQATASTNQRQNNRGNR